VSRQEDVIARIKSTKKAIEDNLDFNKDGHLDKEDLKTPSGKKFAIGVAIIVGVFLLWLATTSKADEIEYFKPVCDAEKCTFTIDETKMLYRFQQLAIKLLQEQQAELKRLKGVCPQRET
jgi:hypothetical protein